jgi:hypothetical protein
MTQTEKQSFDEFALYRFIAPDPLAFLAQREPGTGGSDPQNKNAAPKLGRGVGGEGKVDFSK